MIEDGTAAANPFRMIKKRTLNRGTPQEEGSNRALTPLQWDYVLETAERMAQDEPERHERTLFIVATLFAMYLRVSDIVGRPNWHPVMGDFRQDPEGNWWYHGMSFMKDDFPIPFSPVTLVLPSMTSSALAPAHSESISTILMSCDISCLSG